jgi:hypothetical protein
MSMEFAFGIARSGQFAGRCLSEQSRLPPQSVLAREGTHMAHAQELEKG